MRLDRQRRQTYVATGGRDFDPALPLGRVPARRRPRSFGLGAAGALVRASRLRACWRVDLPGHGRSGGAPLPSIAAMADWTAALIDAARRAQGRAGRPFDGLARSRSRPPRAIPHGERARPDRHRRRDAGVARSARAGRGQRSRRHRHGGRSGATASAPALGGSLAPGLWMLGGGRTAARTRAARACCSPTLSACNAYQDGLAAAAKVTVPATLVLGERDMMTPVKGGTALAAALPDARVHVLKGAGHMLMSERPDEVLDAVRPLATAGERA